MKKWVAVFVLFVAVGYARAEETPPAAAAQASHAIAPTELKATMPWDSVSLTYFTTFHGAPLKDLGSSMTVDAKGNRIGQPNQLSDFIDLVHG